MICIYTQNTSDWFMPNNIMDIKDICNPENIQYSIIFKNYCLLRWDTI